MHRCPRCASIVDDADVDRTTRVALCRACGEMSPVAALVPVEAMPPDAIAVARDGKRALVLSEEQVGGATVVRARAAPQPIAAILVTALGTVGALNAAWTLVQLARVGTGSDRALLLMPANGGIPFLVFSLIASTAVALYGVWRLGGALDVRVAGDAVTYVSRTLPWPRRRTLRAVDIQGVVAASAEERWKLELRTAGGVRVLLPLPANATFADATLLADRVAALVAAARRTEAATPFRS